MPRQDSGYCKQFFYLTPSHSFKIHVGEGLLLNVTRLTEEHLLFNFKWIQVMGGLKKECIAQQLLNKFS